MNPGPWGILIIVVALLLLFGRGKISGMMGEVATGIKAFQRGMKDEPAAQIPEENKEKSNTDA